MPEVIKPYYSYINVKGTVRNIGNVTIENLKILLMLTGKVKGETYFLFDGNIGKLGVEESKNIDTNYFIYFTTIDDYNLSFYCLDGNVAFQLIPTNWIIKVIPPIGAT
ncbi:MAG: hypothetical protein NC827_05985 [Candidatus Omnitrophica bacterium]|nr:hypothetical protein [Candidatus Omnitrophota bacterium]